MLTLTALEEGDGLRIRTEVVDVPVWRLPLPSGEQLELVVVPAGAAQLGSPATEHDRSAVMKWFAANRDGCSNGVDVEALRSVCLDEFALVRQPISQRQWRAVVENVGEIELELEISPGLAKAKSLWDRYGQPGEFAVDSVSWHQSQEWLRRLNSWLQQLGPDQGFKYKVPQLFLPSENQWEGACRAGTKTAFHFGDTLDESWALYDATAYPFGRGRKGSKGGKPWLNGTSGLVNRLGLTELHGQLWEWCEDSWHPNPVGDGRPRDCKPWRDEDTYLMRINSVQKDWRLLRGGSWFVSAHNSRAAARMSFTPGYNDSDYGFRPCCIAYPCSSE